MSTPPGSVLLVAAVVAVGVVEVLVEGATVPLTMTVALPSGTNTTISFVAEEESLKKMGITKEMMESTLAHADSTGKVSHVL